MMTLDSTCIAGLIVGVNRRQVLSLECTTNCSTHFKLVIIVKVSFKIILFSSYFFCVQWVASAMLMPKLLVI